MKKYLALLTAVIVGFTVPAVHAQPAMRGPMGGPPPGPRFGGDMAKVFGENSSFSATMEFHMSTGPMGGEMLMPGKIAYLEGKSRFEMNLSEMKGGNIPPQAFEHMKAMGMDQTTHISRPDRKVSYLVYPGMQGYIENPAKDSETASPESDYKTEITELGKETVDGHPCVKNKIVLTDKDGKSEEIIAWNATDLKKFPVKIQTVNDGSTNVMLFKEVKLAKPDAAQFEPPADFKKHDNMMSLMMSKMGGMHAPPGN